jgi:hypothetical protein
LTQERDDMVKTREGLKSMQPALTKDLKELTQRLQDQTQDQTKYLEAEKGVSLAVQAIQAAREQVTAHQTPLQQLQQAPRAAI